MRYVPVCSHLPLWWQLTIRGTPTTGRRAGGRRTSWWRAASVLLCPPGWILRMLKLWDLVACVRVADHRDKWPPNSCVEGWLRFIKPARHSKKSLWLTHEHHFREATKKDQGKLGMTLSLPEMSQRLLFFSIQWIHLKHRAYYILRYAEPDQGSSIHVSIQLYGIFFYPFKTPRP